MKTVRVREASMTPPDMVRIELTAEDAQRLYRIMYSHVGERLYASLPLRIQNALNDAGVRMVTRQDSL